jgi:hypothetical protein
MTASAETATRGQPLFWVLLVCSSLTTLVALGFFLLGLADGTVSEFNIVLWVALLGVLSLSVFGGWLLFRRSRWVLALLVLSLSALPGLLAALFLGMLWLSNPHWQ